MTWLYEVIADASEKRYRNELVFETQPEAVAAGGNLMDRWTQVTEVFVVETDKPATVRWDATKPYPACLTFIETKETV
jgi:hypothetical protein